MTKTTTTRRPGAVLALLFCLTVLMTLPAHASFKWVQEPDLGTTGVSVEMTLNYGDAQFGLGDDWECQEIGPVDEIQLWCGWAHDAPCMGNPNNVEFTLAIYSDIPASQNPNGYSMPGDALWMRTFQPGEFTVGTEVHATKGWLTPPNHYWYPCCDNVYSYLFDIPETEAFVQQGTPQDPMVYWLVVQARPMVNDGTYIGWLTSTDHWNDKAVWGTGIAPNYGPWSPLYYPQEHVWSGEGIDLAFAVGGPGVTTHMDFGDAPDPSYQTLLASDGARHRYVEDGPRLGLELDTEADGQPDPMALGDDEDDIIDDEDGLTWIAPCWIGHLVDFKVETATGGLLDAFADFNCDGDWDDAGEHFIHSQMLYPGENDLQMPIPPWAPIHETTYLRLRISSQGGLMHFGPAEDGEVEDYEMVWSEEEPLEYDFGDAPDGPYPTLLASDGARHFIDPMGPMLGQQFDSEFDAQPDPNALGDDNLNSDDEDGVSLPPYLTPGQNEEIEVTVNMNCYLDAWIDWNADGDWDDPLERIAQALPLVAGTNTFSVAVPAGAPAGTRTYARFRVSEQGYLGYTGLVQGGEVEDYAAEIEPDEAYWDFGDAPDPTYPTLLDSDGARHRFLPGGLHIGATIDHEDDGQPHPEALGDDLAGIDDEEGVSFGNLVVGEYGVAGFHPSANCLLDAWIDWNGDGHWAEPEERIATDYPLYASGSSVYFLVPQEAGNSHVFARVRVSSAGGLLPTGPAEDGEVQDHRIFIIGNATNVGDALPGAFGLQQNMPNPFNPSTTIRYDVPSGGANVALRVFDASGRLVRTLVDGMSSAGHHSVVWDGRTDNGGFVPSGVYFYVLETETHREMRKMLLLK